MCEPATLTAIGTWVAGNLGTISAIGTAVGTVATLDAQRSAANQQSDNIKQAAVDNYATLNRQAVEDRENLSVEGARLQREVEARRGAARAAAAASEVGGLSVDALLLDLSGQGLSAASTAETNYVRAGQARADQLEQTRRGAHSQLNQVKTPGVADYLGAGLSIGRASQSWADRKNPRIGGGR